MNDSVWVPTRASIADADTRLYRKGNTASELRYMGHSLSGNRHGLIASALVTAADGYAEREAAKVMIHDGAQVEGNPKIEIMLGADKGCGGKEFIDALTDLKVRPHVAQNTVGRKSAVSDAIAEAVG